MKIAKNIVLKSNNKRPALRGTLWVPKGFTVIEIIMVIAIIAILAGIVSTNVMYYLGQAKKARANADADNMRKAFALFDAQYGDYPYMPGLLFSGEVSLLSPHNIDTPGVEGTGEPYLIVDGSPRFLSEFYKLDWDNYNAEYFVKDGYYVINLTSKGADGKFGCGTVGINDAKFNYYGYKTIICQDCPCSSDPMPFQTEPY